MGMRAHETDVLRGPGQADLYSSRVWEQFAGSAAAEFGSGADRKRSSEAAVKGYTELIVSLRSSIHADRVDPGALLGIVCLTRPRALAGQSSAPVSPGSPDRAERAIAAARRLQAHITAWKPALQELGPLDLPVFAYDAELGELIEVRDGGPASSVYSSKLLVGV